MSVCTCLCSGLLSSPSEVLPSTLRTSTGQRENRTSTSRHPPFQVGLNTAKCSAPLNTQGLLLEAVNDAVEARTMHTKPFTPNKPTMHAIW